jgi:hypothetical protein
VAVRLLAPAAALLLGACASQPSASSPAIYPIHSYRCCSDFDPQVAWHAGQHVTLHWEPVAGAPTADNHSHQVTLRLTLTGPFPSVDALKQGINQGHTPAGVRSIDAAALSASDRSVDTPVSELDLPPNLAPGYYNLASSAGIGGNTAGGSGIVIIQ